MEIALLAVGLAAVVFICIRLAVAFVRWSRAHPEEAGAWAAGVFIRDSLGNWVDSVNDSPSWGSHHHGHDHHGHGVDSHSHSGHSDGGSSGDVIGH